MYKEDLALNNLQWLMCHENQTCEGLISGSKRSLWRLMEQNITLDSKVYTTFLKYSFLHFCFISFYFVLKEIIVLADFFLFILWLVYVTPFLDPYRVWSHPSLPLLSAPLCDSTLKCPIYESNRSLCKLFVLDKNTWVLINWIRNIPLIYKCIVHYLTI